ncbi:hypothetical protein BC827DRAFT_563684 [Russula dissimulans]|nr:hypothetical protein BC827DRAFT_563684 [Russula dissimulans]
MTLSIAQYSVTVKTRCHAPPYRSTSSNFETLFDSALEKYTEQTGKDLRNHPLKHRIDTCDSPASLFAVFQEQAQTFDDFKNGDHRLIKWLQPIVNCLYALSTNAALSTGVSVVFPPATVIFSGISILLSVRISSSSHVHSFDIRYTRRPSL